MNKREKFWIQNLLKFTGLVFIFAIISLFNIIKFNNSYMEEELKELYVFEKQIEWAVKPYLLKNDYQMIQKYCKDFRETNISLRIFNDKKGLIAASSKIQNDKPLRENLNKPQKTDSIWKLSKNIHKNKEPGLTKKLEIGNQIYYLELTMSEEDVLKSITEAQHHLLLIMLLFFIVFIAGLVYIFTKIRYAFNKLENSIIKISDGKLDTSIEVPQLAILEELALSVKKMTLRLKNQIKRLEKLEKYKSDFVQNISHEIKTPITAINSAIELLEVENPNLSKQDSECLGIIHFQVKVINKLVNDILNLSEIEVEKTQENKSFNIFNLNETIEQIIDNQIYDNMSINFIKDSEINNINGDENLIITAISNLISNAVRYSGSDRIDIILSNREDEIQIIIRDYGIGIANEHLEFLFDRFYRVDKARSRETGGNGLGLAIVKNIVEFHNGRVEVESKLNSGSSFIIRLPSIRE